MKESKKKKLRMLMKSIYYGFVIILMSILPVIKLLGYYEGEWKFALAPLGAFLGFWVLWGLGYFTVWLGLPGEKD